jgi:hypothetical protein
MLLFIYGNMENKTILLGTVIVAALVLAGTVIAKMPDSQCHRVASNIDNSVQNANPEFRGTYAWNNPCTGTEMMSTNYANYYDAPYVSRRVFENGDVIGHRMNTRYMLCSDGRAKVENWALYYIRGMGWGVWFNHPLVDWTNQYNMEQCSTMG